MKGFKPTVKMSHGGSMDASGRTHRKIEKGVMKKATGGGVYSPIGRPTGGDRMSPIGRPTGGDRMSPIGRPTDGGGLKNIPPGGKPMTPGGGNTAYVKKAAGGGVYSPIGRPTGGDTGGPDPLVLKKSFGSGKGGRGAGVVTSGGGGMNPNVRNPPALGKLFKKGGSAKKGMK